jgi:hypothetical protein
LSMRKNLLLVLWIILTALVGCADEYSELARTNRLLKEEFALAKSPGLYFIFDLKNKQILLKARGILLEEWKIEKLHRWGDAPPLGALTLEKKSALFPPKRAKIKPADEEAGDTFELDALELKDMPSAFTLYMDRGISVYVRPKPQSFLSRAANLGHSLVWYLGVPLKNLWLELRKKSFAAIEVRLTDTEKARALYWALADGTKGIILP